MTDWDGMATVLIALPMAMMATGLVMALVLIINELREK